MSNLILFLIFLIKLKGSTDDLHTDVIELNFLSFFNFLDILIIVFLSNNGLVIGVIAIYLGLLIFFFLFLLKYEVLKISWMTLRLIIF